MWRRSRRGRGSCGRGRAGAVSRLFSRLARERTAGMGRLSRKTDGSGYGELDRGHGDGKPTFSAGKRGEFVNRSDGVRHP
jgi:hypothetical protein